MTMILLIVFSISQKIFPSEGQPMGPNCMNVYPMEGALQRMTFPSTQGCQNLAICPLVVSPSMSMPCEVQQIDIPEPHKFERWKGGKWKMVRIGRIPWEPCEVRLKPQEVGGSRHINNETGKGTCTPLDSSPMDTGNEMESQIPQVPGFGNKTQNPNPGETPQPIKDEVITSVVQKSTDEVITSMVQKSTLHHPSVNSSPEDKKNETTLNKRQVADFGSNTEDPSTGNKTHYFIKRYKTISVIGRGTHYIPYFEYIPKNTASTVTYSENGWISSLCQGPMILYERYGPPNKTACVGKPSVNGNLTNQRNTNVTVSPATQINCESPGLVTLSCLACMMAKNAQNNTVNGTIFMKNLDSRLDPIDHVTVGARNSKNSSSTQIHRMITKEQMSALEDCLADGNKSEPYLVNGRPLIVKLKYLNQTEKQLILTKKTGHDFLIALPRELEQEKDEHTDDINDKPIDDLSATDNNLAGNLETESSRMGGLEDMLISTERSSMKEEDAQETKVPRHMSNDPPCEIIEPKKSVNEESTTPGHQDGIWSDSEEEQDDRYDYVNTYRFLTQPLQCHYNPLFNIETNPTDFCQPPTSIPLTNRYYPTPKVASTTLDHFSKMPSLNHGYARQMEPLASHLLELPDYLPQPASLVSGRQIQRTIKDMKDQNTDRCASFQTLRHGARLKYPINCQVSPYALNVGTKPERDDSSHKPDGQYERKAGVKYEKCRRTERLVPELQFRQEATSCDLEHLNEQHDDGPAKRWECEEYIVTPRTNPELNRSQCSDLGSVSWHENHDLQQLQNNPGNYIMTRNLQHWSQLQPIIQRPLRMCQRLIY